MTAHGKNEEILFGFCFLPARGGSHRLSTSNSQRRHLPRVTITATKGSGDAFLVFVTSVTRMETGGDTEGQMMCFELPKYSRSLLVNEHFLLALSQRLQVEPMKLHLHKNTMLYEVFANKNSNFKSIWLLTTIITLRGSRPSQGIRPNNSYHVL